MKLEIIQHKKKLFVSKNFLKSFLCFVEKSLEEKYILPADDKKLVIAFLSSEKMRGLNKQFLKKDSLTDVLSFSSVEEDCFGELALCEEKIRSQSQDHGLSLEEETAYLVLHGFLHLLGYHHEQGGAPAKKMYQLQDGIFEKWREKQKGVTGPV